MGVEKKRSTIKWTETARLQLVEAVIAVEEEMRKDSNRDLNEVSPRSADRGVAKWTTEDKWDAISDKLPLELREKTWNHNREMFNTPKCRTFFYNLLKAYRDQVGERTSRNAEWILTEPVIRILKKREDLANVTCSVQGKTFRSRSGSSNSLDAGKTSPRIAQQMAKRGLNGEGKWRSSVREDEASWSLEHEDELQSAEDFNIDAEREEGDDVDHDHDSLVEKVSTHGTRPSRSVKESKHAETKLLVQHPTQSRSETRSQSRDGTQDSLRKKRKCKAEKGHARYGHGDLKEVMEKPQRRLDLELSRMNCWFQNRAIPLVKSIFSETICSEIDSGKRPKLSVHQSRSRARDQFDQLVQKDLGRIIDNEMRASFHKLRAGLVKDLKNMSADLARTILKEANTLNSGPTSSRVHSGERCPFEELRASSRKEWNQETPSP